MRDLRHSPSVTAGNCPRSALVTDRMCGACGACSGYPHAWVHMPVNELSRHTRHTLTKSLCSAGGGRAWADARSLTFTALTSPHVAESNRFVANGPFFPVPTPTGHPGPCPFSLPGKESPAFLSTYPRKDPKVPENARIDHLVAAAGIVTTRRGADPEHAEAMDACGCCCCPIRPAMAAARSMAWFWPRGSTSGPRRGWSRHGCARAAAQRSLSPRVVCHDCGRHPGSGDWHAPRLGPQRPRHGCPPARLSRSRPTLCRPRVPPSPR
jgi:hypothetical protein